ncbi:MAG TPA: helix-turn-helix transcriptional regulator [Stellaceae bacterium]|nr:helix-turn-helix transcriptional regulator [Stellaceae bacterium]
MKATKSSGNVFSDIGLDEIEAAELTAKTDLVAMLMRAIRRRALSQVQAARVCGVDQPTLSKVLNGKLESITIDRLARWIVALGGRVRITVRPPSQRSGRHKGSMRVEAAP